MHTDGHGAARGLDALRLAVAALSRDGNGGSERRLTADQLEVAVLDRTRTQQRKFKRVLGEQLVRLLQEEQGEGSQGSAAQEDADAPAGEGQESGGSAE